jgi:hypothetical protein
MKINVKVKGNSDEKPKLKSVFSHLLEFSKKSGLDLVLGTTDKKLLSVAINGIEKGNISPNIVVSDIKKEGKNIILNIDYASSDAANEEDTNEFIPPIDLGNGILLEVGKIYVFTFEDNSQAEFYIDEGKKIFSTKSFAIKDGNFYNPLSPHLDCDVNLLKEMIEVKKLTNCEEVVSIEDVDLFKTYLDIAKEYCDFYISDMNIQYLAEELLNVLKCKNSQDVSEQAFVEHLRVFEQEYFNKIN